jgi:toxin ParE1/3/4
MPRRVVFSAAARADLDAIYEWIADRAGVGIASRFADSIRSFCRGLADFPKRGAKRDDLATGLRLIGFRRRATIAFSLQDDQIVVLRILYRVRDVAALLTEGG